MTAEPPGAAPVWLHRRFEAHARRTPGAPALRAPDADLSYAQLNDQADRLARRLRSAGVGRGDLVGLVAERSAAAIVGLLAILKAGAAYVPIDPAYPGDWQAAILTDSRPKLLLGAAPAAVGELPPRILLSLADPDSVGDASADDPVEVDADDLMYVIYTSGSSGPPKGVMVSHGNVARLFPALSAHLTFAADDVWTQSHSLSFGFSVWEIWGALAHGGCLVVVPPALSLAPSRLLDLLADARVTVFSQTPTAFRMLMRAVSTLPEGWTMPSLRLLAFSGEPLEARLLAPWLARFGDQRPQLANLYALTETAGEIAWHRVTGHDLAPDRQGLIGIPLPDVRFHLHDADGQPLATGEVGELLVGGPAVAQGYLNRAQLTAERFPADPDSPSGAHLYRTGDLARRLADGSYQFVGRADRQVKIRGYRVEPGDVEAALVAHPQIDDAVVLADDGPDGARLAAYLLVAEGTTPPTGLRAFLQARLPHYAIPDHFAVVDRLPLTPNGKLDVAALRAHGGQATVPIAPAPPVVDSDARVTAIWREILGLPTATAGDDFFDQGGHSLLTLRLVVRLEEQLGVSVSMTDVFEAPTLGQLSRLVRQRLGASEPLSTPAPAEKVADERRAGFMRIAIAKAREAMANGQPPYAACIVKDGEVIAAVHNVIWRNVDATAHAEVEAIRAACRALGRTDLAGCTLYSTAEPCSMCLSAGVWANVDEIVYSASMADEARFGLSQPTVPSATMLQLLRRRQTVVPDLLRGEMLALFEDWLRIKALEA